MPDEFGLGEEQALLDCSWLRLIAPSGSTFLSVWGFLMQNGKLNWLSSL